MATYNGHKNWNHWNVSLWISNDEGIYRLACDAVRTRATLDGAARYLTTLLPSRTPDGARYSFSAVRAALAGWR